MSKIIEIENVTKTFKGHNVYDNMTLVVESGECIGIVGENGSGKSVLFQMIAGLMSADTGVIKVAGKTVGENMDFPQNVGILINEPGYIGYCTGYKNLQMLAQINNKINNEDIKKTMNMVGLKWNDKTLVRKYSMGMKQKLGIAQAIMENQEIIILDEPFNALDYKTNSEVISIFERLKKDGKTILLTSHQHQYLNKLCDKMYCIRDNKIVSFTPSMQAEYFSL